MNAKNASAAAPRAMRMTSPGYGFEGAKTPAGQRLPWSHVDELLRDARNYWIGTSSTEGRPHTAPVWGLWLENVFYFSTGDESRKARNMAANPEIAVHPEVVNEAVILEGRVEKIDNKATLKPVWAAYKSKYDWDVEGNDFYSLRPRVAYSFAEDLAETATRWVFDG